RLREEKNMGLSKSISKVSRDAAAERSAAASRLTELGFQRALIEAGRQPPAGHSVPLSRPRHSHRQRLGEQFVRRSGAQQSAAAQLALHALELLVVGTVVVAD